MLYSIYEMQHSAFAPLRMAADQGQYLLRSPYNPMSYTPAGRMAAAACDLFEHTTRRYGKPKFDIHWAASEGRQYAVTETNCFRNPFGQLKHFERESLPADAPRVLIVAPMSGHFATLLRGTVAKMVEDHDVYITDWRDARDIPLYHGSFDLDDYIDYVIGWLEELGPNTHVIAVCQPSVPVFGALALMEEEGHPCTPASMTLMGGPIDTRECPTQVNDLATNRPLSWFEQNVITHVPPPNAGMMRRVYPGFLQLAGFMTMNLNDHISRHQEFFKHLIVGDGEGADATRTFYEEYRAVMDMTAEFYLQTIQTVFQDFSLPKGEMMHRDRRVDCSKITRCALLCVEGERDDISGIGQTKAALKLASNLNADKKHYYMAPNVGHYGIFNGRRWREEISPVVKTHIAKFDALAPQTAKKTSARRPKAA